MSMKVIQVVGYKNAGKTTLVCEIVRLLAAEGWRVGTVKRDAHGADPEPEAADTRRHREAGAGMTALVSARRTMRIQERTTPLDELLAVMEEDGADAVIVEGFKEAAYPKLVLLRGEEDSELLGLTGIIGIAVRQPSPACEQSMASAGFPVFRTDAFQYQTLLMFMRKMLLGA